MKKLYFYFGLFAFIMCSCSNNKYAFIEGKYEDLADGVTLTICEYESDQIGFCMEKRGNPGVVRGKIKLEISDKDTIATFYDIRKTSYHGGYKYIEGKTKVSIYDDQQYDFISLYFTGKNVFIYHKERGFDYKNDEDFQATKNALFAIFHK